MRQPTRRHSRHQRGMTLIEIVVVLVLMGLLLAFALPRLLGADAPGNDQQAQTTLSGAADTVVRMYADQVTTQPWDRDEWQHQIDLLEAERGHELSDDELVNDVPRTPAE